MAKTPEKHLAVQGAGKGNGAVPKKFSKEFLEAQWKPGQSGNPHGAKKRKTLESELMKYLDENVGDSEITRLEALVKVVFSEGVTKRNSKILVAIMDRLWPKPIRIQGDPDMPLVITSQPSDLSLLSDKELTQLKKLRDKARGGTSNA